MPTDTRYDEAAIAEIFRQAAEAQNDAAQNASGSEGLTLAELQEIGREAGLSPEYVARAAARLAGKVEEHPQPTFMGVPIGVEHSVGLPGAMSDDDWDRLVVDLRETFRAPGKIRQFGSLREWSNGNLHVLVEPAGTGHRLRMSTLKGSAREIMTSGAGFMVMALLGMGLVGVMGNLDWGSFLALMLVALVGLGMGGVAAVRLPGWIRERGQQMDDIARRTIERMAPGPALESFTSRETIAADTAEAPADLLDGIAEASTEQSAEQAASRGRERG